MNSKTSDPSPEGRTQGGSAVTLGEQLRRAREARGLSLRQISEGTRISTRYLEAIESNDYKQLPGGIFNRSFIKSYAKHVGMSEPDALDLYSRTALAQGEPSDEALTTPRKSLVYTDGDGGARSPVVTWLLSGLVLGALCLAVLGGLNLYQRRNQRAASSNVNPAPQTANTQATPQAAPSDGGNDAATPSRLNIRVRANGQPVYIEARADEGDLRVETLRAGGEMNFSVERSLSLRYPKNLASVLVVTINDAIARAPTEGRGRKAEMIITPDNYRQYLP